MTVLSNLICTSLTEDRYGTVQRDIPRILEALLSFLDAVEDAQVEIHTKHPKPSNEDLAKMNMKELGESARVQHEVGKAGEILGHVSGGEFRFALFIELEADWLMVCLALKDGVARIVRTFGDKLLAFKFPPRTARKLQGFIDYN